MDKHEFERNIKQAAPRCFWPGGFDGVEVQRAESVQVDHDLGPMWHGTRGKVRGFGSGELVVTASFIGMGLDGMVHRFSARWYESSPQNWILQGHDIDMSGQYDPALFRRRFDPYDDGLTTAAEERKIAKRKAKAEPPVNVQAEAASFEAAAKFLEDDV